MCIRDRVYAYFNSQREFVRTLTNLAEELRFMPPDERQAELQPRLDQISLPQGTYYPLAHSGEKAMRLLRFTPNESIVFNTKARCPLYLICEVAQEEYLVADVQKYLGQEHGSSGAVAAAASASTPSNGNGGSSGRAAAASADGITLTVSSEGGHMSVGEKKREPWPDKAQRLQKNSPLASTVAGWELASFIVKSNDDLRQEVFIMQMIRFFDSIWPKELTWLNCYFIEATGPDVCALSLSLPTCTRTHPLFPSLYNNAR